MRYIRVLAAVVSLVIVAASVGYGQNMYNKGQQLIHGGIGFGLAGVYGDATLPPIVIGYENGFDEKISIGGILGYSGSTYGFSGYEWKYSYILIGVRGAYHFLENNDEFDAYGGALLGYNIVSVTAPASTIFGYTAQGSYLLFGIYGGGRYYFNPNLAVFGEIGYGAGFFTVGVAYKL